MARAIDGDKLLEQLQKKKAGPANKRYTEGFNDCLMRVRSMVHSMPTLTTPNEPLTIEQLNDMDGQPVWDKNGKCYLVDTLYRFCSCADYETVIVDNRGTKHKPNRYILYRHPPEE